MITRSLRKPSKKKWKRWEITNSPFTTDQRKPPCVAFIFLDLQVKSALRVKDYYEILGIHPNATAGQIKAAYRRLAVRYHPDKNPDPQAEEIFKEINEAYDVLSDPNARTQYDWQRNPFNTIVADMEVEAEKATPHHRDPAYHRRGRPPVTPRPGNRKTKRELIVEYLPYFRWACWVGLIWGVLFWLDYVLPYAEKMEAIENTYVVPGRKGSGFQMVLTDGGKKIEIYTVNPYELELGEPFTYRQTLIFRTVMDFDYGNVTVRVANVYGGIALFPTVLLIVSLFGFWYQNDLEFFFSASVVCSILFIMNLLLIL